MLELLYFSESRKEIDPLLSNVILQQKMFEEKVIFVLNLIFMLNIELMKYQTQEQL